MLLWDLEVFHKSLEYICDGVPNCKIKFTYDTLSKNLRQKFIFWLLFHNSNRRIVFLTFLTG